MVQMIKSLIPTEKLKINRLREHRGGTHVFYDSRCDALLIQIVPPETETIVHYIDDKNIALLYEAATREIVGLQVEGFKKSFLPKHADVERVWKWSKKIELEDFGDLVLTVEKMEPAIAREVVQASRPVIERKDVELAALLNRSFAGTENYATT